MNPTFSVIIPVYNIADYLVRCLDSVLAQSFTDYEIIVINDGSTDDTPAIADRYASLDSRITVIHKANQGVSVARNTGIEIARGKFFLFFDGDDFVEPYCLQELEELTREKQVDTIIYGYHRFEKDKIVETCKPIFNREFYEKNDIVTELIPRFIGFSDSNVNEWLRGEKGTFYVENPALWRTMVSGDIIRNNNIGFNVNLKVGEDTIFTSEYLSYANRCYVSKKPYYYLVLHSTSTIARYEKLPLEKLEQKTRLLTARKELTEDIMVRRKIDLTYSWRGTVLMSCIELAFLLAGGNSEIGFFRRYQLFRAYTRHKEVARIIQEFRIQKLSSLYTIPFFLLKSKLYFILFICAGILRLINFKFERT